MTNIESLVLRELHQLPPIQQNEVLDFVQFLKYKTTKKPMKSVHGLCADLKIDLTEADIAEARQAMWGSLGEEVG